MGEELMINDCYDGVECSEEQHQENRRTEFVITEYIPSGYDGQSKQPAVIDVKSLAKIAQVLQMWKQINANHRCLDCLSNSK